MDLNDIACRVSTCLVLHNILVADRMMDGDYKARYDPAASLVLEDEDQEDELLSSQHYDTRHLTTEMIGIGNAPIAVRDLVARKVRFDTLGNKDESRRLHSALVANLLNKRSV